MNAEDYSRRQIELAGWQISLETYKLGDVYHCTIYNVDPGARFARAEKILCGEEASHADLGELHAGIRRRPSGLVPHRVRLTTDNDMIARPRQHAQRNLVRHRAGGQP